MDLFERLNREGTTIIQVTHTRGQHPLGSRQFSGFRMAGWRKPRLRWHSDGLSRQGLQSFDLDPFASGWLGS